MVRRMSCMIFYLIVTILWMNNSAAAGDIKGKVKAIGTKNNANAVIYIDKIPGK